MPKIKNIIIFVVIGAVLILIYIFFTRSSSDQAGLVSSTPTTRLPNVNGSLLETSTSNETPLVAENFLALLLNVKNIKLADAIFSDPSFINLQDTPIDLTPDGTEGRPNPFAQFGSDSVTTPINNTPTLPPLPIP